MAKIQAGVVFDQPLVEFQQFTGTRDHLQTGDPVAGHAVADDLDAAGIGGDVATDLAGTAGGKVDRVD